MEATSFACPKLPGRRILAKPPCRRRLVPIKKVVVSAGRDMNRRDYSGRLVDESMIVLRLRLREMKMSETSHAPPSDWMEWEKQYYEHYNEDVCEAVGLLQSFLMNTRPSLALGVVVLLALSVPISTSLVLFYALEIAKGSGATNITTQKEGGIVKKGHEEGIKMAVALLEEFGLPLGLLPLADVIEVGFVRITGYMWIVQKKKIEHNFKMISKLVSYDTEITGYVEKKRIKKLKGVKAKELMLWPPVSEITLNDPPTGKIRFKSLAGITKTFPEEAFATGQ